MKYQLKLEKEGEKLDKNHLPFEWKWQIIDSCLVTECFPSRRFVFIFVLFFILILIISILITVVSNYLFIQ